MMTLEEAWRIVEACKGWNTAQVGLSVEEHAIVRAKRAALLKAWTVISGGVS